MTTVVVAEKPSVARDIAAVLGASTRGEGCLRGNGWCITWALGHLVHFAEPDDYGADWAGRWSLGQLPMIPARWRLRTDKKTSAQFKIVKALLTAADTERVVCATDAGREGELIFRLIVEHARCRKPMERLWISSLTPEAIRAGFQALRPGDDYAPLAAAARARAQSDWLVGMNLTRAYTVHNRVLCTIGRVQTPTLAMIVARDAAIANFTKAYFYELVARLAEGFEAKYSRDGETRIDQKSHAERLKTRIDAAIEPHRTGTVTSVDKQVRHNRPPPLYDLTTLQRDANRRFGFTAAKVLELAQTLYETHKLISYPRTESRHIGEDMLPELPGILDHLDHPLAAEARARLDAGHRLGKAYVDRTKLTDHHAILPTARRAPANLPEALRKIYDLVTARFVAVFLPDQRVEETRVTLDIGGETFVAKGSVELAPGWKRVEPRRRAVAGQAAGIGGEQGSGSDGEQAQAESAASEHRPLPPLQQGQTVHVDALDVVERETKPPRPYDDATLLNAMKHAGREIDDDALAAAMKSSGLGTPATRAEIIEKLLRTGYIERQRKQLRATDKGKALIALVAEPLRSVELTAAWEQRLKDIEQGSADADAFYQDICAQVRALIPQVAAGPAMTAEQVAAARAAAPQRGGGKGRGARHGGARAAGGRRAGRDRSGANPGQGAADDAQAKATGLGTCPVCKAGEIVENSKAFGCARWRNGCGFTIWKTIAGHRLTEHEIAQLIEQGVTAQIDDLKSKTGKVFSARLRLDDRGKVGLDFDTPSSADAAPRDPDTTEPPGGSADKPASAESLQRQPLTCPRCGRGRIIEGRHAFGCNRWREGCDYRVPKATDGRRLSDAQLRARIAGDRLRDAPAGDGRSTVD
ncbi:type IA DNA topoisomerase [uncultured Thiohalocapsa sp.]|uniref:type IA DNA topoisomerase n=1 Tax=uncultured Thiohalocapsa sp. TaxID=768990 RepID=UPI0025EB214D|nr:type IA DNA topoisomerase [uncultured Thiohalocapsa sp.]